MELPEDLLRRVDVAAAVTDRSQSEVVTDAVGAYLESIEKDGAVREVAIEHYLDGTLGFDGLEWYLGSEDAVAVRSTSELLDRGDVIASDLAADDR